MLTTHLSLLESCANSTPNTAVFKVPAINDEWHTITYSQFYRDVETLAQYWARTLEAPQGSIVGMWIGGYAYIDVLNIYGLSRAGFIPQLFSLRLPNPDVVGELLRKTSAQALIYDAAHQSLLDNIPLPKYSACTEVPHELSPMPLPSPEVHDPSQTAFIFHTSGSTSGSPKLVWCSYRWIGAAIQKASQVHAPYDPSVQVISVWMGSMCHIGQSCTLLGHLAHSSCLITPSKINFSSDELVSMIAKGSLNRLCQFSAFLSNHLRHARSSPKFLSMLTNLDEVLYAGMPLPQDDETFARNNGINLVNLFGSTECGPMMKSTGTKGPEGVLLHPLVGTSYEFRPVVPVADGQHSSTARLLELVILPDSMDCPHPSLHHPDGTFHTGDLFQKVTENGYLSRGRDDDWIKTENSLRCDTKAIEDNVRSTCGHLVSECVVVGTGRPSPCLFIETAASIERSKLVKEIIRNTRRFNSRRYLHERISPNLVVVVPPNTLPRTATKGNIRRKAVEETFRTQLDELYIRAA